ncbi:hypothetical protein D3C81_1860730 [compost metagenome]
MSGGTVFAASRGAAVYRLSVFCRGSVLGVSGVPPVHKSQRNSAAGDYGFDVRYCDSGNAGTYR